MLLWRLFNQEWELLGNMVNCCIKIVTTLQQYIGGFPQLQKCNLPHLTVTSNDLLSWKSLILIGNYLGHDWPCQFTKLQTRLQYRQSAQDGESLTTGSISTPHHLGLDVPNLIHLLHKRNNYIQYCTILHGSSTIIIANDKQ